MQNSGLNAGDITNGAHSRNTSSSKKESSGSKSSGGFSEMFRQAFAALKDAEAAAKTDEKKQAAADKLVDKFIQNFREADGDTQLKIAESLKKQNLKDIMRPEIQRPEIQRPDITNGAHSPERNGASTKSNNADTDIMDKYGNFKLSDGKGLISYNPEALEEERASRGAGGYMAPGNVSKGWVYNGSGKPGVGRNALPDDVDEVEYTYKPGDTFAQFLINSGLSDGSNLWGPNGDVEYYRKQLNDQGIYGNIPIGKTIRLKRRK